MFICVLTTLLAYFPLPGLHRSAQGPWVPAGGQLMANLPYEQPDASIVLMTHDGRVLEGPMLDAFRRCHRSHAADACPGQP